MTIVQDMDGTNQTSPYPPTHTHYRFYRSESDDMGGFSFCYLYNLFPVTSFYRVVSPAKSNGI